MENQREISKRIYDETNIDKQPMFWHIWKRAFDAGVIEAEKQVKNNVALDGVVGSQPTAFEKNNLPIDVIISFNKGVDIYKQIQNYENGIIGKTDFVKEIREIEEKYNYNDLKE